MKKLSVFICLSVLIALTTSNCKKSSTCSHCIIKDANGTVIKDYDEKCGTTTDVNDYENSAKKDAVQYGGTCTCTHS